MTDSAPGDTDGPHADPQGRGIAVGASLALFLLFVTCILNFVDRSIVNILAEPISKELHLNDAQIGLMTGLAFTLLYSVLGIPLARLIDRPSTNRSLLISACLTIWSGLTAACGLAGNFAGMLATRVGVGIGEAGCTPAAHSLITDIVPAAKRSSALAIYGMGVPAGGLLGLVIGGYLADTVGWRAAFYIVGVPGVIVALIVLLVIRDPRRRAGAQFSFPEEDPVGSPLLPAVGEVLRSRSFLWLLVGGGALSFLTYGRGTWTVIYFIRSFGLSPGQVGLMLGLVGGVAGVFGTWLGGVISDHFGRVDPQHSLTVAILAYVTAVPLYMVAYSASTWPLALGLLVIPSVLDAMSYGPSFGAIQGLARPRNRGLAVSIKLLIQSLVGGGLGPLLLGALSDHVKRHAGNDSVRQVLFGASLVGLIVAFAYWRASLHLKKELWRPARPVEG